MTLTEGLVLALLSAVLAFVLRESKSPLTPFISILGGVLLLLSTFLRLGESEVLSKFSALLSAAETKTVFKVLSVGLLTEIAADTCEELGSPVLAKRLVFFGNAEILLLILPTLSEMLSLAEDLLL